MRTSRTIWKKYLKHDEYVHPSYGKWAPHPKPCRSQRFWSCCTALCYGMGGHQKAWVEDHLCKPKVSETGPRGHFVVYKDIFLLCVSPMDHSKQHGSTNTFEVSIDNIHTTNTPETLDGLHCATMFHKMRWANIGGRALPVPTYWGQWLWCTAECFHVPSVL